ncbi:hypothetical protein [Bradyrhizobium sp. STM 3557]|uniref:hypothetical protein n=1 Tax=Bradyrhizobium sp. STM 3557 TaxID=578920 RepID=UPI00388DEE2B
MRRSRYCNRLPSRPMPVRVPAAHIPAYVDTSLVSARALLGADETVKRMASDMREASHREGGITREDLQLLGWTPAQINDHADAARRLANEQSVAS